VTRLIRQRLGLFDTIASVGIVTRVRAPFQPLIASQLALTRSYLRHQIEQLFRPELAARGTAGSVAAIAAIDVLTSFESVHLMLDDQQLTRAQIEATLVDAITRLLEA
jgi:hypothetical protein